MRAMLGFATASFVVCWSAYGQTSLLEQTKPVSHFAALKRGAIVSPNIRIHPNPTTHQFETSIMIHPSNPNVVLAAAIAGHTSGTVTSIGSYYTSDGGVTWIGRDTLSTHTNLSTRVGDPAVAIDASGNLFVNGVAGVSTFNVIVARSGDSGATWTQTGLPPENSHKNHLAIDVNPSSLYLNNIYVSYAIPGGGTAITFSRSTDRGQNFSTPVTINGTIGSPGTNGPNLAVGPNGEVYATWVGTATSRPLGFNKSTDGGVSWGTATTIRTINNIGSVKGIQFGGSLPSMAVDSGEGTRRGWIYIVYPERNPSTPDIFLIRSSDNGNTWSDPVKVNQDNSGNDQWPPWITVDAATGNLFVVYYDSRNFSANDSAEVYISASRDGGATFEDTKVSDAPFLPSSVSVPPLPSNYGGSYIGIAALQKTVWVCWNDNRTGVQQAYVARIGDSVLTSIAKLAQATTPKFFRLDQNFPNPFNPSTEIQFSLRQRSHVTLKIFDLLGREVTTLVSEELSAGSYSTRWDAPRMPSGVYLYRLQAGEFVETKKLILLR